LCVQVYDLEGKIIPDAELKMKRKKLRFDKKNQYYIEKKSNRKGLLEIRHDGFTTYYDLSRNRDNARIKRGYRKVLYGTPLKYVWIPVRFVVEIPVDGVRSIIKGWPQGTIHRTKSFFTNSYEKIACIFDDDYCNYRRFRNRHTGYMVFNKPKYLPQDTVKFKAFLVTKKGKPINKEVDVILWVNRKENKLTQLKPYRKGAYEYEFVLHDSLQLQLDKSYNIFLQTKKEKEYISGFFRYEDYELTSTQLAIRLDNKKHENDLNILDGRIEVLVKPGFINKYLDNQVFVPDTLLFLKQELESSGETEIALPDSLFPKINLDYKVNVKLLTSDNEVISERESVSYYYQSEAFEKKLR